MTIYPSGIDSSLQLPTVAGATDEATAINALQAAVIAIETELGVNPRSIYSNVSTRLSMIETRLGPGPSITGGSIDINDANLTGTLSLLKGGTGLSSVGTVNTVIASNGVSLSYTSIVDDNVDTSAAIAGSKIDPDFGSQSVITSGDIQGASIVIGASGPTVTVGTGAPSDSEPNGSLFLRVDGTSTTGAYTRQSGSWFALGFSGGSTSPAGSDTQIQFNDAGSFGADAGLSYNKTTNVLTVSDALAVGSNVSTSGAVRLGNGLSVRARNNANSADLTIVETDVSNYLYIGSDSTLAANRMAAVYMLPQTTVFIGVNAITAIKVDVDGTHAESDLPFHLKSLQINNVVSTDFGGGTGVIGISDASTVPTTNPTNGLILYSEDGALKYRNDAGDVFLISFGVGRTTNSSTGTLEDVVLGNANYIHFTNVVGPLVGGIVNIYDARVIYITFTASGTLKHESLGSTAAYRINTASGGDISVEAGETISLIYDGGSSRWRPIGAEVVV
jgi:hypothetical protein